MPGKTRVFISYSRSDGLEFARKLRAWLEEKGIPLFQDLVSLEGGEDFLQQIYKAIDQVEFVLLLMTPNAVNSDAVKKEWRHARQSGVCVYPIVPPTVKVDFGGLPHWMSSVDWYDLNYEEQWTKLLNDLSRSCKTPRVPFMVEDLPKNFVQRPAEFDSLINLLRDPRREESVDMTAALRGAGGFGKTTLAKALCHDGRIQEAFDDGILWVTLSENPGDLASKVLDLVEVLSGDRPGFDSVEAASTRLAELLADRDILMVIDDVWNATDLAPFLRDPKLERERRCGRLITTRNRDTLPVQARSVNVDAMRQDEAVKLLGAALPEGEDSALRNMARRLGEWPVLLKLANGVLRDRVLESHEPLRRALNYLNADLDENGLTAFDASDARQRDQAVASTLAVSLARLKTEERDRYRELAIFPEDVDIPLSTVELFWQRTGGLSRLKTEKLCERLHQLSLLLRYDLATRTIGLHDVMRAYLSREPAKQADAKLLHGALLDAWGDPHQLPDDYAWRRAAYHLKEAGREGELRRLLFDFNWVQAALAATDVTALLAHYELAADLGRSAEELPGKPIKVPPWRRVTANPAPDARGMAALQGDEGLALVQGALRLSAHVLAQDKAQLPGQLCGRLIGNHESQIRDLLSQAGQPQSGPWLKPKTVSLAPPGGPLLRTLVGHTGGVDGVAVMPDGNRAISASWDNTLKVWDLKTGQAVRTLKGHTGGVDGVAVMPKGDRAISASDDNTLKVWDLKTGEAVRTLKGHTYAATAVAVMPDGDRAVSASDDNTLKVWDLKTGQELLTLAGHTNRVESVAVIPDVDRAISASRDKTLKVWDLKTGRAVLTLKGHTGGVTAVAVTPDGDRAISASWDDTLRVWDLNNRQEARTLKGHTRAVMVVAVMPEGDRAISASDDNTLKVWDLKTGQAVRTLAGHTRAVTALAVMPDGDRAISASRDKTLKVLDLKTGQAVRTLEGHTREVRAVAVTPEGDRAISASNDKTLTVWDLKTGQAMRTLKGHTSRVTAVAVRSDGDRAISASEDETLKVWDLETGQAVRTLKGHTDMVEAVAVIPDGDRVISASADQTLRVWDLKTGQAVRTLVGHTDRVTAVAVIPDGDRAISASDDNTLKVWDLKTGQAVRTLAGHTRRVTAVAVMPDGERAISAFDDYSVKVLDLETGKCLASFTADAAMTACAVARDGVTIVAGDSSGAVHFLKLEGATKAQVATSGG